MHVVLLSARTGWHTDELLRALAARGHVGVVMPYEALIARLGAVGPSTPERRERLTAQGVSVLDADAVLARIIPSGSLEQIIYRVDALHWIEDRGIPVLNSPRAIERTVDKFYTSALLREAGLPTPETVVCERASDALEAVAQFGDAVIKPIFGSMGHGMVRVAESTHESFTLATLDGHTEAGHITFSVVESEDAPLHVRIESWARARDSVVATAYHTLRVGKQIQTEAWITFLQRLSALAGVEGTPEVQIADEEIPVGNETTGGPVNAPHV